MRQFQGLMLFLTVIYVTYGL